jgi:hypothetical protein
MVGAISAPLRYYDIDL